MKSSTQSTKAERDKLRIAFVHPDLGIGGAERLVVDAAMGLQEKGHEVVIYTSHCDKAHCFEEIKNGQLKVEVLGDFLPTNFNGKLFILFANLRQLYLTSKLAVTGRIKSNDLYVVDQLSTCVPLFHMLGKRSKVLFYCHFPDQLLAPRTSLLKKLYRIPFDLLEELTMNSADCIVVNSKFTRSVYHKTFRLMAQEPNVVYPCVGLETQRVPNEDHSRFNSLMSNDTKFYLSINRYERKKNIELAITSFALSSQSSCSNVKLVLAGGYDERIVENKQYLRELQDAAHNLKLSFVTLHYPHWDASSPSADNVAGAKIIFLTSVSSSLKDLLLQKSEMLLYTPSHEHFGIVPLEAMKLGRPVLAVNNGGPLETVVTLTPKLNESEATGWLRPSDPEHWAAAIEEAVPYLSGNRTIFHENGPARVRNLFSRDAMTVQFEKNIGELSWSDNKNSFLHYIARFAFFLALLLPVLLFSGARAWPFGLFVASFSFAF
ncbi:LANO_0E04038g1_1 [Lachancea nothofagi CBS 11611]|uniref:Alpha-1,3/1,6-mannosyltransferase ALG2 n=1 Tax=Lachancea nothofagi CBS 11611 TaxID=1266666 RepID=A0A1G4JRN0_9SACH|nr:LANO_0E04038g1_1 [Lachancea nothofagi CBS 11611]